jgi:histidyl-tRNA synthetase
MIETLPGFREFYPEACRERWAFFEKWREVARRFGFEEFDPPILEPLELFTQKSGEEIVGQLFAFQDRGGRQVALRPETTPSLARFVAARNSVLRKPVKWFNITENFRYERPQKGRLRSFFQFNADILGEASTGADAELVALAIDSFRIFGLGVEDFYVRLSDRRWWVIFLKKWGIEDPDEIQTYLAILDKWERRSMESIGQTLEKQMGDPKRAKGFMEAVQVFRSQEHLEGIQKFLDSSDPCFDEWHRWQETMSAMGYEEYVKIDLGIVRGLAYYTGFVFEVFGKSGRALAGGGRYDGLMQKLCGVGMAAVGFAAGDVTLREILIQKNKLPVSVPHWDAFVVAHESVWHEAVRDVQRLREAGHAVLWSLAPIPVSKQFTKAFQSPVRWVVFYGPDEMREGRLQIQRKEESVKEWIDRGELISRLRS